MKKRRIVLASVLKPVDDTRMYEKMGVSLAKRNEYEVFIIGQRSDVIPAHQGIHFLPHNRVKRVSLSRWLLPFNIWLKVIKVRPELLIVNTHELLIVSMLNRILFGCQIVYDIRENHYRNIRFSEVFPIMARVPLALWVRLKEKVASPLIHQFILAEKAYENELTFIGNRFTVLENKTVLKKDFYPSAKPSGLRLLFSGTIAKSTGIFEAISLAKALHKLKQNVTLTIIGYCALGRTRMEVKEAAEGSPYIRLQGFDQLVPHQQILGEINKADFGIVYYPPAPHTMGSVPTKLYEYMAHQLPIITWPNQTFAEQVITNKAGLIVNNGYEQLLSAMQSQLFYPKPIEGVLWDEEKFGELIDKLLR